MFNLPSDIIFSLLLAGLTFFLWLLIWKGIYEFYILKQQTKLDKRREEVEKQIIQMMKDAEKRAEKIINEAERKASKQLEKIEKLEDKVFEKEKKIEKQKELLEQEKKELLNKEKEIESLKQKRYLKLSELAKLSEEEARKILMEEIKNKYSKDLEKLISKLKLENESTLRQEAAKYIVKVLPRVASDVVSEYTTTTIDLPEETIKGKIIGREGRNIQFFEKLTWVELIIDDTPMVVRLSSYDPEKRFIASETLKRLIKDGRINPIYIESVYNKVRTELDDIFYKKWEEVFLQLNIPLMNPDIVKMVGKMYLRYSYGQNLLNHSIEVAKISEMIANELWLDWNLAKKAWLLHDIWKLLVESWQAHAKIGADFLRKYNLHPVVIEAAESHHFDIMPTNPISWIVAAADAISASRPWARFNTKELFIERLENLEKLIMSIDWVNKVNIYQAGRQIIVFVDPDKISDLELENLLRTVAEKIEDQLDYPGMVRVIAIREKKVSSFVK